MTKAGVQYLEYRAIAEAKRSNSFVLNENKQTPKEPNLTKHQRDFYNSSGFAVLNGSVIANDCAPLFKTEGDTQGKRNF